MTKHYIHKPVYSLLLTFIFLTSCYGQTSTQLQTDKKTKAKSNSTGQAKLVKTQGSTESDNIRCGLQDREGNLWFGTTREGVYRYDGKLFTQFTVKDGLSSNSVYSLLEDKLGNIWLGTSEGICRYDGKYITPISIPFSIRPIINNNYYYTDWSKKSTVWSMLQDKNGIIWFGTGDGVYCYNGVNFTRFLNNGTISNKEGLHLKMIDDMLEDKNGNIWFASGMPPGEEGVCRYDGESITGFKPNGDGWIRCIREDKKGNLWFGGRGRGNFFYNGKSFTNFTEKLGIGNPILVDKTGNIWFGGEEKLSTVENEGGIWRYDGKIFRNFNIKDGISKYHVFSMLEDRNGNIWIGTRNTGLYKYDGKTFANFSE